MQLVATDIGNSSTKCLFEKNSTSGQTSICTFILDENHEIDFEDAGYLGSEPAYWSVSSVNQSKTNIFQRLINTCRPKDTVHLIAAHEVPIQSSVESREQLGRDRLIAGWMATEIGDTGPRIVVDAGTAVTIDLVTMKNSKPSFEGGFIFPGAQANLSILNQATGALPDLSDLAQSRKNWDFKIGRSTEDAILQGVYQSQIEAIQGMTNQLLRANPDAVVYTTGGGIKPILKRLPADWNHKPNLVLLGAAELGRRAIDAR